jgi:cyclic pyranopterin phosphate synthase
MSNKKFSHVDESGKARMVDISHKPVTDRVARAEGFIKLDRKTVKLIRENDIKKGDVLRIAEIAGIQAAKYTAQMIPLCHPLLLTQVEVRAHLQVSGVSVTSLVKTSGSTGVEMEALSAVSISLLTVYDMCKAVDKNMEIGTIRLVEKIKKDGGSG